MGYAPLNNGEVLDNLLPHDFVSWDQFTAHLSRSAIFGFKCAYHPDAAAKSMKDLEAFLSKFGSMGKL
ncbi:MAG: hypothetical protein ACK5VW_01290 [Holosporales bacterium]